MANATARVPSSWTGYNDTAIKRDLAATAATYYPGMLIALNASGNAVKCTDTAGLTFDGLMADSQSIEVESGDSAGDKVITVERPHRFAMNCADTVSASDIGTKLYAEDDSTVTTSSSQSIFIGWIDDVISSTRVLVRPRWGGTLSAESFDGNTLEFDGATGVNVITMPDNLADALSVKEGSNAYVTFNTTDTTGEQIVVKKRTRFGDNVNLALGDADDVWIRWDATDLDMLALADDSVFKIGNGTNSFDLWFMGNNAADYLLWDASANSFAPQGNASIRPLKAGSDPGDGNAVSVVTSAYIPIVTAGAETRTIAAPSFIGQELLLYMKTDGGNAVVTVATTVNEAGNNTITFANTGEYIKLQAVEEGANLRWRTIGSDLAVAVSTV